MPYFTVTTPMTSDAGANVFFVFRPDDERVETLEDLQNVLAEAGSMLGVRWKFNARQQELVEPRRVLVGISGVVTVTEFHHDCLTNVIEPQDSR